MTLSFYFDIEPKAKQSARFYVKKGHVKSYQTSDVKAYERAIEFMAKIQLPKGFQITASPIKIESMTFAFKAPKSLKKADRQIIENGGFIFKSTKPDLTDNLMKPIFDALEKIIYKGDQQIYSMNNITKVWRKKAGISLIISYK